jgi:hypothetical protein
MESSFISAFRRLGTSAARAKYLSRVFGIFSEEIVRLWAAHPECPYEDLGRPAIRMPGDTRGHILDFTLREKGTGKTYATELKCEVEYQGFKYFVLTDPDQLSHHTKPAFFALLAAAKEPMAASVAVRGKNVPIDGSILIWGAATDQGRALAIERFGFAAILTIDAIVANLRDWGCPAFREHMEQRRQWTNDLLDSLVGDACAPRA